MRVPLQIVRFGDANGRPYSQRHRKKREPSAGFRRAGSPLHFFLFTLILIH